MKNEVKKTGLPISATDECAVLLAEKATRDLAQGYRRMARQSALQALDVAEAWVDSDWDNVGDCPAVRAVEIASEVLFELRGPGSGRVRKMLAAIEAGKVKGPAPKIDSVDDLFDFLGVE